MKNNNINMFLAALVVVLFIGVGVYPTVAVEPITSTKTTTDERINPKDYLFQTIIDIANNPDVKDLLEQHSGMILSFNHNDRSAFIEILHKKPMLLFPFLITKSRMTIDYLNSLYDLGVEISYNLGEERTVELLDSVESTNSQFYNELDKIIAIDEELSYRMDTLQDYHPIICAILEKLYNSILATINSLDAILDYLEDYFFIDLFLGTLIQFTKVFIVIIGFFIYQAGWNLDCWD